MTHLEHNSGPCSCWCTQGFQLKHDECKTFSVCLQVEQSYYKDDSDIEEESEEEAEEEGEESSSKASSSSRSSVSAKEEDKCDSSSEHSKKDDVSVNEDDVQTNQSGEDSLASAESAGEVEKEVDLNEETALNDADAEETSDPAVPDDTAAQTEIKTPEKDSTEVTSGEAVSDAVKKEKTEDQADQTGANDASEDPQLPPADVVEDAPEIKPTETKADVTTSQDAVLPAENDLEITPVESIEAPEPPPTDEAPEVPPAENLPKPGLDDDTEQNLTKKVKHDDLIPEDVVSEVSSVEMVQGAALGSVSFVTKNTIVVLFLRVQKILV